MRVRVFLYASCPPPKSDINSLPLCHAREETRRVINLPHTRWKSQPSSDQKYLSSLSCTSQFTNDFNSQTRSTDSLQGAAEEHWKHSASWEAATRDQENTLNPLVHFHTRAHGRFYIYRNIFNEFHETTKKKRKISFEFINSSNNNNNNNNNNMTMVTWFEYVIPINADLRLNFSVKTVLTEKLYETVRAFVSAQIQTPQKLLKTFSDSVFQVAFP